MYFVSPQHEWGNTALTVACENGYATVAKLLLEYGAIVDYQNKVHDYYIINITHIHSTVQESKEPR